MTNFEKIKQMNIDEMANFFAKSGICTICKNKNECKKCFKEILESEVLDDEI